MRASEPAASGIITLTSDFGLADPYVAAMKGVMLGLNPRAVIVDVSHEVRPQRLLQAVFVTESAWPFLAPIGLVFAVAGLVFGPALLVGGLIMGGIACIGWLRDASRELASVEAHGQVEPVTRDPERAFPKALGPVFVFVAGLSILVTLTPWLLSLLPGGG